MQAGAFFPDWGYNCLLGNANSEAAHWPPFLKAAVDHIIENYGENPPADSLNSRDTTNDEDREAHKASLIAFIFAVASHATAGMLNSSAYTYGKLG